MNEINQTVFASGQHITNTKNKHTHTQKQKTKNTNSPGQSVREKTSIRNSDLSHEGFDHTLITDRAGILILEHINNFVGVIFLENVTNVDEQLSERAARHGTGVVLVVSFEGFHHVLVSSLPRRVLDLFVDSAERLEVDAFSLEVGVCDHFLDVSGEGVEAARSHDVDDLEVFDFAVTFLVVHVESLLRLERERNED